MWMLLVKHLSETDCEIEHVTKILFFKFNFGIIFRLKCKIAVFVSL